MLSLVPTLVLGRSVLQTIAATYSSSRRRLAVLTSAASASRYFPRNYSRSSSDNVNVEDGSSGSSSSSSDDSDGEDDDEGVDPAAKPVIQKPKEDIPGGQGRPAPHQAMSAKLLDQILSMKVTRNRRIGNDDPDHPVEAEAAKDGDEDDESDDGRHLVLAKPTAKFRQIRKKLQEEHEAEKELQKSGLNKELVTAIKEVASSVSGDPATIESELLTKLKDHSLQTNASRAGLEFNLGEMVTGMKIDRSTRTKRSPASEEHERSRFLTDHTPKSRQAIPRSSASHELSMQSMRPLSKVDLFGAPPLNIFSAEVASHDAVQQDVPCLELWERLERRELDLLVLHPPANGFEEMITWTKQGKLWHFPIDNEQGMDEEAKVGFHEHVFLEPLISDGFPKKGPVRHFMELVAVGLSKNPYLSVTRKREHIDWFRQYFKDKANVLEEVGALD